MSLYKVKLHAKFHWDRDILIFEFEKNSRKEKNNISEKVSIILNILKLHWIMEGAVRNAFEDEQ